MKVFFAGAGGAIGRPLVPMLVEAGHEVTAMTRSPEKAAEIEKTGARGVVVDVFDPPALNRAVAEAAPDVVINQMTALPKKFNIRKPNYEATNRLRTDGTRNLIAAARDAGAKRIVAQSIVFVYEPGPGLATETDPVYRDAPGVFGSAFKATMDLERQTLGAEGMEGVVLRYGFFYGPGTYYDPNGGSQANDVSKRRVPVVGSGAGVFAFLHVDDAASATVAALERGQGIYNVVDDDPAPMAEWLPAYAEMLGAKKPMHVPAWVGRLAAGSFAVASATSLRGASNARAKQELGWEPSRSSWRGSLADGGA